MVNFYVTAFFSCLQYFNKFFRPGLEAQIWKGADCRAVGYVFSETCWKRDFFKKSNTFLANRWAQIHTNAFLLTFLHCFSGTTLALWEEMALFNTVVNRLWSSVRMNHFISVIHGAQLILVFTFPIVRLVLIFHCTHVPHTTRWRHRAWFIFISSNT